MASVVHGALMWWPLALLVAHDAHASVWNDWSSQPEEWDLQVVACALKKHELVNNMESAWWFGTGLDYDFPYIGVQGPSNSYF